MKNCRGCQIEVDENALACPKCGCPYPAKAHWDGYGYEFRSKATWAGLPLLHVSFKYRANRMPVVARGVIAIGQFAMGIVTIAQFSIGVFSLAQFTLAYYAIAQIGIAYSLIAQFGLFIQNAKGQVVYNILELLQKML